MKMKKALEIIEYWQTEPYSKKIKVENDEDVVAIYALFGRERTVFYNCYEFTIFMNGDLLIKYEDDYTSDQEVIHWAEDKMCMIHEALTDERIIFETHIEFENIKKKIENEE